MSDFHFRSLICLSDVWSGISVYNDCMMMTTLNSRSKVKTRKEVKLAMMLLLNSKKLQWVFCRQSHDW